MSASLLTTQQVRDLLGVDASTVYRMASDGRLPAIRIGHQWRFPAHEIESLLSPSPPDGDQSVRGVEAATAEQAAGTAGTDPAPLALPAETTTAVLETIAPVLGVSMVVTDLDGQPITRVVNPPPAIAERLDDPRFAAECTLEWRGFAHDLELAPRLRPGRFGFLCAHSLVRHDDMLVAMVMAGGMAPDGADDAQLFHLDQAGRQRVLETLPRTAALLSRLVTPRVATTTSPR
ncbi:MAG: helix-turn-helix domain-containing protein [Nitriliruptoraceae bacterium]